MCTERDGGCVSLVGGAWCGPGSVAWAGGGGSWGVAGSSRRGWLSLEEFLCGRGRLPGTVKVAVCAGRVDVAFSLSAWPRAPVIAGAGAVTGGAGCGVPVIRLGRSVRPPCPSVRCPTAPSAADRVRLRKMACGHETGRRLRAGAGAGTSVVLHVAGGCSNACVARVAGRHVALVRCWRGWFARAGLSGLRDGQCCGGPGSFAPLQAAEVEVSACRLPADGEVPLSCWSGREPACEAAWWGVAGVHAGVGRASLAGPGRAHALAASLLFLHRRPRLAAGGPSGCWLCTPVPGRADSPAVTRT